MERFIKLDADLFRWIHAKLASPLLDQVMPWFSHNRFFAPLALVAIVLMVWKGRLKGTVCVLMLVAVIGVGDGFICQTVKRAAARPRPTGHPADPTLVLPGVQPPRRNSFPSSHTANWFSAAMVLFLFYRRSALITLPIATLVGFSRVYTGAHFPGDVIAGAILGTGYAIAIAFGLESLWRWAGCRYFPIWWARFPSLVRAEMVPIDTTEEEEQAVPPPRAIGAAAPRELKPRHAGIDQHWLRLGYVVLGLTLVLRLLYISDDVIQLSEDEAYQWVWSKHPDISYYSKPPLIAYTQWLGTHLWGDTAFGVRFFSPVIGAVLGFFVLRFFAREINARAGFILLLIVTTTPMLAAGSVLMTVDPLSVLFWTLSMLAGWRAVQDRATTKNWLWTGLWLGLGFLSKYTALFQLLCWAVFFWLWRPARKQLQQPGPYLALVILVLCTLPVVIWNGQRDWITVAHVAEDAGSGRPWEFMRILKGQRDFLAAEFFLLNPVYFVATIWACIAFWKRARNNPRLVFFFCMGAPLFLAYVLQSFRSRLQPNWIAPSVLPLFFVMVIYWDMRLRLGAAAVKGWLIAGLTLGTVLVIPSHNTDLLKSVLGQYLPVRMDPMRRAREWDQTATVVEQARQELLKEGKPVFIIGDHYGMVSQLTFHIPEGKAAVMGTPLIYHRTTDTPKNQYYFWRGYAERKGENAIFVQEVSLKRPTPKPLPDSIMAEFESVEPIGIREIYYHGRLMRPLQFFACRNLK